MHGPASMTIRHVSANTWTSHSPRPVWSLVPVCPSTFWNTRASFNKQRMSYLRPIHHLENSKLQFLLFRSFLFFLNSNEKNFHIFYYLCEGLGAENKLGDYFLDTGRRAHRYVTLPPLTSLDRQVENTVKTKFWFSLTHFLRFFQTYADKFQLVRKGFDQLGFASDELDSIYSILAAVIHLGDVDLVPTGPGDDNTDRCRVANEDQIKIGKNLFLTLSIFPYKLDYCFHNTKSAIFLSTKSLNCSAFKQMRLPKRWHRSASSLEEKRSRVTMEWTPPARPEKPWQKDFIRDFSIGWFSKSTVIYPSAA